MLMPFKNDLEEIYKLYIKKPLLELGYNVKRADDISKSTSILEDIVNHIIKSDIIIADLTYKNPNVFYELGRAHQLKKWMVQIAQEGEELPFNLKLIRTIFYKTDNSGLERLKEQIILYIETFEKEKYIDRIITDLENSESFSEAIDITQYFMENESDISKDQLIRIAKATQENDQLYKSYRVLDILKPLLSKQKGLLPEKLRDRLEYYGWIEK